MQSGKYSSKPLDAYLVRTDDAHQVSCDSIPFSSRYICHAVDEVIPR